MNKKEFFAAIEKGLEGLPQSDINKTLEFYSEMIDDRMEDGETEEEAVAGIGRPEDICRQILLETPLPRLVRAKAKPNHTLRAWEIVLLVLGSPVWLPLLFAVIIVISSIFFAIWTVIVSLYFSDLMIGVASVGSLAAFGAALAGGSGIQAAMNLGSSLICFGIAVLMFFGLNKLVILAVRLCRALLRGIKSVFVSKKQDQERDV